MTNETWQQFVETAKSKFEDVSLATEDLYIDNISDPGPHGTVDILEFEMPDEMPVQGRFQVRRENKPLVLDKKSIIHIAPATLPALNMCFQRQKSLTNSRFIKKMILATGMKLLRRH